MAKHRVPIPERVSAAIMFASDRTCCVCNMRGKAVQIHHIDEDPANNDPGNLAVLCLDDHDLTQISGGFGKKLSAAVVRKYRDAWLDRVQTRRKEADKAFVEHLAGVELPDEPSVGAAEGWTAPSEATLFAYIDHLPVALAAIHAAEDPQYENGTTGDANEAADKILSELELMWVYLSRWYPPGHFGEEAAQYINKYRAERYEFHGALLYVGGELHGTMTYRWPAWSTIRDMEYCVRSTVVALTRLSSFDLPSWLERWQKSSCDAPPKQKADWKMRMLQVFRRR